MLSVKLLICKIGSSLASKMVSFAHNLKDK